jgi:hypothetical protein
MVEICTLNGKKLLVFISFFAEICRMKGRSQGHNRVGLHSHPSHVQSQWLNTLLEEKNWCCSCAHMGALDLKSFA